MDMEIHAMESGPDRDAGETGEGRAGGHGSNLLGGSDAD